MSFKQDVNIGAIMDVISTANRVREYAMIAYASPQLVIELSDDDSETDGTSLSCPIVIE